MNTQQQPSASRSSLVSGLAFFGVTVLNYGYALAMAWLLPVDSYGVLGLTQSWILIAGTLLGSGFPWGVSLIIARHGPAGEAYAATKSALAGNLALAFAFSVALLLAVLAADLSFGPRRYHILALIVAETVLLAVTSIWSGVLQGRLRFGAIGIARVIEALLKLCGGVALVWWGFGAVGAVGATVAATGLALVYTVWSARDFRFWRAPGWGDWQVFRGSLTIFFGLSALTVIINFDLLGIDFFSGSDAVLLAGYYQAASMLPRMLVLLARTYASALFPYLARADEQQLPNYVSGALKYMVLLIVAANLVMAAVPQAILTLIFPESYLVAAPAMRYAALGSALLAVATMVTTIFQARGKARVPAIILPLAAVVELAALAVLLPRYGIVGAGLSLLAAGCVACLLLLVWFARLFPSRLSWTTALRYVAAGTTLVAVLLLLPHTSDVSTLVAVVVALLAYVVVLALLRVLRPADLSILVGGLPVQRWRHARMIYTKCLQTIERLNSVMP